MCPNFKRSIRLLEGARLHSYGLLPTPQGEANLGEGLFKLAPQICGTSWSAGVVLDDT